MKKFTLELTSKEIGALSAMIGNSLMREQLEAVGHKEKDLNSLEQKILTALSRDPIYW